MWTTALYGKSGLYDPHHKPKLAFSLSFLGRNNSKHLERMEYKELTHRLTTDRLWTYSFIPFVIVDHGSQELEKAGQKRPIHPFEAEMDPGKAGGNCQHTSGLCQLYREGDPQPFHHQDLPDRPRLGMYPLRHFQRDFLNPI
jgi:hypothetical protein